MQARCVAAIGVRTSTPASMRYPALPMLHPLLALRRSAVNSSLTVSLSSGGLTASRDSTSDQRVRSNDGAGVPGDLGAAAGVSLAAMSCVIAHDPSATSSQNVANR